MLPFRNGPPRRVLFVGLIAASLLVAPADFAQQSKKHGGKKNKDQEAAAQSATPSPGSGAQVPLPIGHEAKGLVLPDIDENGHLRGRFVAGTARRVDQNHMQLRDLNITTYTEDNQIDLQIAMADSVLDLNTRVLTSPQRTTIKRADFELVGDTAQNEVVTTATQASKPANSPKPKPSPAAKNPLENESKGPITTEIYADEASFDSGKNTGIFTGHVKVFDPRFNLQSDRLTVYLHK